MRGSIGGQIIGGRNVAQKQQVTISLIDDFDASPASETLRFGLDGRSYEIDLNRKNAAELRRLLEPYAKAGRRSSGRGPRPPPPVGPAPGRRPVTGAKFGKDAVLPTRCRDEAAFPQLGRKMPTPAVSVTPGSRHGTMPAAPRRAAAPAAKKAAKKTTKAAKKTGTKRPAKRTAARKRAAKRTARKASA